MLKPISLLNCLFFISQLSAQSPSVNVSDEPEKIFSERVFIHTDKSTFVAGEMVWFKAYIFNGNFPGSLSTNFYIDLINAGGTIIESKKLPVLNNTVYGNFFLSDSLLHGYYFLRAYTQLLVVQGNKYGVLKPIAVLNPDKMPAKYPTDSLPGFIFDFFPESGYLIKGLLNTIAFKATDQFGDGIDIKGYLFNNAGDTLTTFKNIYPGTGTFSFTPGDNEKYFAEVIYKDVFKKKYDLPQSKSEGVLLSVSDNPRGIIFQVQKTDGLKDLTEKTRFIGYMYNKIVFRDTLKFKNNEAEGVISTTMLPAGVLHLVVTGEDDQILASRSVFIQKSEMITAVSVKTDSISFLPKAKNVISLLFPDSLEGNFSVSLIAYHPGLEILKNNSITSSIFLDAEKEIPVSVNSHDVINPDRTSRIINEFLLMTEKQKRTQEINEEKIRINEKYIEISGKVYKEGTKKPVTAGELIFMMQTKDSASAFMQVPVHQDGNFVMDNLVFDDTAKFYYQLNKKNGGVIEVKINRADTIIQVSNPDFSFFLLPDIKKSLLDTAVKKEINRQKDFFEDSTNAKVLKEVIVKARIQRPVSIVNKKYTSGLFSSMMNAKVFDFINEPPLLTGQNIFDYLQGRVAGLKIERRWGRYILYTNRAISLTGGFIPVLLFLNEMPAEPDMLTSLLLDQIALVKYFPAGSNNVMGFGVGGRLAIYTKVPEDVKFTDVSDNMFLYNGYTSVQEFADTDYTTEKKEKKDNRNTLYWNPYASISSGEKEFRIRFYNSDNAKKFKLVVQGFTYDGRLIDFEKIIE